jgi:NADH-quinone oxidoreductase subunit N
VAGIGRSRPLLAWPLTIGMLALAGLPGTSGFMGKLFLIEATVDGDYTWLGVAIVIGTMVSLAYYLRVVAAVWMRPEPTVEPPAEPGAMPAIAGGSPETDAIPRGASRCALIVGSALICGAATIAFGVAPSPLLDWASHAAGSLSTTV